jgi:hypothetical protein
MGSRGRPGGTGCGKLACQYRKERARRGGEPSLPWFSDYFRVVLSTGEYEIRGIVSGSFGIFRGNFQGPVSLGAAGIAWFTAPAAASSTRSRSGKPAWRSPQSCRLSRGCFSPAYGRWTRPAFPEIPLVDPLRRRSPRPSPAGAASRSAASRFQGEGRGRGGRRPAGGRAPSGPRHLRRWELVSRQMS